MRITFGTRAGEAEGRLPARRALRPVVAAVALLAWAGTGRASEGIARVEVDAREAPRGILKAHLSLPVSAGPLTLLYPKWLPGRHSPAGPITSVAGPRLSAQGRSLPWRRDPTDPYVFHLEVPAGVDRIEADLEVLSTPAPDGIVQGLETPRYATESLAIIEWNQVVLYPAGVPTDALRYRAAVRLPQGWRFASALHPSGVPTPSEGEAQFEPTSLTTLIDSTLIAGRYLRSVDLGGSPDVRLHIAADRATALAGRPEILEHYRNLAREAPALYGATHYREYQFLWVLTDQIMPDGIEHHESSDNRSPLRTLLDDDLRRAEANLLPHEYSHSWNGKYRRPIGLATPDYQTPMRDELLWVYEGLDEYLGDVLATRSGLLTGAEFRDELARLAGLMDTHRGREWRSLQDASDAAPLLYYQDGNWAARLRRQDDFYQESALLWLEADALIRRESHGQRSLDDFCRRFHGGTSGPPAVRSYDFDEVVATLNAVQPWDWRAFWAERLTRTRGGAPLEGLRSAGWDLVYGSEPNSMHLAHEAEDHELNLRYSLGLVVSLEGGTLSDIIPGSPADRAGAAPGAKLIAVDGHKFSREVLDEVLGQPRSGPLELLVEKDDEYRTLRLDYAGGARWPTLRRIAGAPDLLAQIVRPLTNGAQR